VKLNRAEAFQPLADTLMVLVVNIGVNGLSKRRDTTEFLQIEVFGFERGEKAFCHRIIKVIALSRRALHHTCHAETILISRHLVLPALFSV